MRVLAYEVRRLRGLRSTWLILAAVLVCDAAVAAVLARQLPAGALSLGAAVRTVTAVVPLLPLPLAALGAGALGALSYGHEVRHPGLAASGVSYPRRLWLLAGKLLVIGALSALLALVTVLLNALVLCLAPAQGVHPGVLFEPDERMVAALLGPLAALGGLVVLAGWAGLLATSLVRSAAAGVLILCALPALLEPGLSLLLRRTGRSWPAQVRELLPFRYGLDWVRGADPQGVTSALDPTMLAAVLSPVAVLVIACVLVQARRRAF